MYSRFDLSHASISPSPKCQRGLCLWVMVSTGTCILLPSLPCWLSHQAHPLCKASISLHVKVCAISNPCCAETGREGYLALLRHSLVSSPIMPAWSGILAVVREVHTADQSHSVAKGKRNGFHPSPCWSDTQRGWRCCVLVETFPTDDMAWWWRAGIMWRQLSLFVRTPSHLVSPSLICELSVLLL